MTAPIEAPPKPVRVQMTIVMEQQAFAEFCAELAGHRSRDRSDGHRDHGVVILDTSTIEHVCLVDSAGAVIGSIDGEEEPS